MSTRIDNRSRFLQTLAEELDSQADRVRNLIGDRHWLSDGHHKECLLSGLLARHLPAACLATRGFLISPTNSRTCSTEQDILVIDQYREAPIFNHGGLAIICPSTLFASVSVKTVFATKTLADAVEGLATLGPAVHDSSTRTDPWLGIYFFHPETQPLPPLQQLVSKISEILGGIIAKADYAFPSTNTELCIRVGPSIFVRASFKSDMIVLDGYESARLATAFFLARLVDHVARTRTHSPSTLADFVDAENDPDVKCVRIEAPHGQPQAASNSINAS